MLREVAPPLVTCCLLLAVHRKQTAVARGATVSFGAACLLSVRPVHVAACARALRTLALHGHALQQRGEWLNGACQGMQHANRTQAGRQGTGHRQAGRAQDTGSMRQVVNWIDGTSGTAHAFDLPLRYKLQVFPLRHSHFGVPT